MPKRKASAGSLSTEPPRRRLRSSGPLVETQPDDPSPVKHQGHPPAKTTKSRRSKPETSAAPTPSVKENKSSQGPRKRKPPKQPVGARGKQTITKGPLAGESEVDELNILPTIGRSSRPSTPSAAPRREVMHSVEIITPRYLSRAIGSSIGSPGPSFQNNLKMAKEVAAPVSPRVQASSPRKPVPISTPASLAHPKGPSKQNKSITQPAAEAPAGPASKNKSTRFNPLTRLPSTLPPHLHQRLHAQKIAIMTALRNPPEVDLNEGEGHDGSSTNAIAYKDLCDLLDGTVNRGEGNSCLLIGPRGSGKTRLVDRSVIHVSDKISPIVIRLSGHAQRDDRLAMREIAWQLTQQTGKTFLSEDDEQSDEDTGEGDAMALPPPAHLPALISVLPSQPRPVVVILDAFDHFALHGRQALLYCLLDTAQSCRVGEGHNGIAVIGVTSRVDTINLLEKRVKSRFSGRMFRTAGPGNLTYWTKLTRNILMAPTGDIHDEEWSEMWEVSVERFLADRKVIDTLHETWALAKDVRILTRVLVALVLDLTPSSPFPSAHQLASAITTQRFPIQFSYLPTLSYPSICLLIAAIHSQTSGHDTFTFEMLYQAFRDQVRTSMSAPVQVEGGSIGMVKCGRHTLMGAFEQLVGVKAFIQIAMSSTNVAKEFMRYRCAVDRDDVRKAVDKIGQTNLRKWFGKSQQSGSL